MQGKTKRSKTQMRPRPVWVKHTVTSEQELCPDCFRVVGVESRYKVVCLLGKVVAGATVGAITEALGLKQPTVTHHLNVLKRVGAVKAEERGRERIYTLCRDAHCFDECKIPYE